MRARCLALVALLGAMACGPLGWISGGKLNGELVTAPVSDWSFSDAEQKVQLETRPDQPYSVNVWCVSDGPSLWIVSARGDRSEWAQHLLADGRARVRIAGKLYERKAERVTDSDELARVADLYHKKYGWQRDPAGESSAVLFRFDSR
jgi:hypothetical protein